MPDAPGHIHRIGSWDFAVENAIRVAATPMYDERGKRMYTRVKVSARKLQIWNTDRHIWMYDYHRLY